MGSTCQWRTSYFSLSISSVNLEEDDARFQCQVLAAEGGVAAVQSDNATVTVQVVPEDPLILHGDRIQVRQDSSVEVTCKSFRGKPAAEVNKEISLFSFVFIFNCQNPNPTTTQPNLT